MAAGQIPYRDFFDEYPPLAQPVFLLARVAGASHYALAFKSLMALFGVGALACAVVTLRAMRATPRARGGRRRRDRRRRRCSSGRSSSTRTTSGRRSCCRSRSCCSCSTGRCLRSACSARRSPRRSIRSRSCRSRSCYVGPRLRRSALRLVRRRADPRASAVRDPRSGRPPVQLLAAGQARARAEQHRRRVPARCPQGRHRPPEARQRAAGIAQRARAARRTRSRSSARCSCSCAIAAAAVASRAAGATRRRSSSPRRSGRRLRRLRQGLLGAVRRLARAARPARRPRRVRGDGRRARADAPRLLAPLAASRPAATRSGCCSRATRSWFS